MAFTLYKTRYPALINPGAESGNSATGWTTHSGGTLYQNTYLSYVYEGSYSFYGASSSSLYKVRQRIDLLDAGMFTVEEISKGKFTVTVNAQMFLRDYQTTYDHGCYLGMRFLDSVESVITDTEAGVGFEDDDYGLEYWFGGTYTATAPPNACYVDIIIGCRYYSYMDRVEVTCKSYEEATDSATAPLLSVSASTSFPLDLTADGDIDLPVLVAPGFVDEPTIFPVLSVSATATHTTISGSITLGSPDINPWTISATTGVWCDCTLELEPLEMDAVTGHQVEIELPVVAVSAHGFVTIVGSASLTIPAPTALAYTGHQINVELEALTAAATAQVQIMANGAVRIKPPTMIATTLGNVYTTGQARIPAMTASATAKVGINSSGTLSIPLFMVSAQSSGSIVGTASISIPAITTAATLSHVPVGTGSITLPALQMGADGGGNVYHEGSTATITDRFDNYVLRYVRPS